MKPQEHKRRAIGFHTGRQKKEMGSNLYGLLPESILCFDKLSMNGIIVSFQDSTVRPEPVEEETVGWGNSPFILDFAKKKEKGKALFSGIENLK